MSGAEPCGDPRCDDAACLRAQLAAERERAERAEAMLKREKEWLAKSGKDYQALMESAKRELTEHLLTRAALEAAEKRATEAEANEKATADCLHWAMKDTADARARVLELDKLENEGNHRYGEVCAERDALAARLKTARAEALEQVARCLIKSAEADGIVTSGEWTAGYNQGMRDGATLARALAADTGEKP